MQSEIYTPSTKISADLLKSIEEERQYRIQNAPNPMMMLRMFRVQTELMHRNIPTSLLNNARAGLVNSKVALSNGIALAQDQLESTQHVLSQSWKEFDEKQVNFSVTVNKKSNELKESMKDGLNYTVEKITDTVSGAVEFVKEKVNLPTTDISSMASEEKERVRRMSITVDPIVEGRRHRVEAELLSTVKAAN